MRIVDVHAHLDMADFESDLPEVIGKAQDAGVVAVICVGTSIISSERCIHLAGQWPGLVYAAVGVHPHEAAAFGPTEADHLGELARRPMVVAVGETGLDFHHDHSPRKEQIRAFRWHIGLAADVGKPLIVHSRSADQEVLEALSEAPSIRGIRHCFDRPWQTAEAYLDLGMHISVGAAATRPGYKRFKRALAAIPADRLLLETDSPYQTPASLSGRNEPAYIHHTLRAVAAARGESVEAVAEQTTRNARALLLEAPSGSV